MARLVLPSRLELNRPDGSSSDAPLAKVIFTTFLYVSPVQMIPSCSHTGTPRHFHSSTTSGSAALTAAPAGWAPWPAARSRRSVSPRQSPSSSIRASMSSDGDLPSWSIAASCHVALVGHRATMRHMSTTELREHEVVDADAPEIERLARDAIAASALFGAANVVMQLALLPIGRGVAESTVDSGRVDRHPFKRQRTTGSYLIVAMLGTEAEREAMRREVNRQHSAVVREPGEADVAYSAFDPSLQLWVAACIYVGFSVWLELARGPLTDGQRDAFYRRCARLGTTLQVPEEQWPADRDAFAGYWSQAMDEIEMDAVTRGYLRDLAHIRFLHPWVRRVLEGPNRLLTVGFLPERFREELGEPWTRDDQRRFERFLRTALRLDRRLPAWLRHSLLNVYEWDVKRRIRRGRPIV